MFGSRFLANGLTDSEKVYSFGNSDSMASFAFCNLLDIFAPWPRKRGSSWPTVVHALRKWLASFAAGGVIFAAVVILKSHYDGWCRIVVAVNGNAWTFSGQVIASRPYYIGQSLLDEWRRVSHCPSNWWAFLLSLGEYFFLNTRNGKIH